MRSATVVADVAAPAAAVGDLPSQTGLQQQRHVPSKARMWTNGQLQLALAAQERGVPVHAAAAAFDIPQILGINTYRKRGAKAVLTQVEEQQVVECCQDARGKVSYDHLAAEVKGGSHYSR
jgi:hypothetical protein